MHIIVCGVVKILLQLLEIRSSGFRVSVILNVISSVMQAEEIFRQGWENLAFDSYIVELHYS